MEALCDKDNFTFGLYCINIVLIIVTNIEPSLMRMNHCVIVPDISDLSGVHFSFPIPTSSQ